MTGKSYILQLFVAVGMISMPEDTRAYTKISFEHTFQQDTIPSDSIKAEPNEPYKATKTPTYQDQYRFGDPFSNQKANSPLLLADPSTIDLEVEMDTSGVQYNVYERIGETNFRPMTTMSFEEYDEYNDQQITKEYFHERSAGLDGESAVSGRSLIPRLYISPVLDRLFGGSYVDIQPNGFVNLDFGGRFQRNDNPATSQRQQRYGGFNFDQQISLNLVGKVGEKLQVTANFDNNNTFDFQNNLKIEYTGYEEDIVKKIEIGNVSMPVANSLMTGAQSLFGIKTQLQFGKLFVTTVMSRQQGQSEVITVENGFQGKEFEVRGSQYDENRHFFLGHFFRDNYERWHNNLPQIVSGVNITRVEVYVINRNNETTTTRQVMAFQDLGEPSKIYNTEDVTSNASGNSPNNNSANTLYSDILKLGRDKDNVIDNVESTLPGMTESTDFVKIGTARKLDDSEYDINKQLGYISLLRKLQNDEMLAVSYEYTYNGQVYKVGELTEDYSGVTENEVIFMKMLRPNKINTDIPAWDLMMKNIYYLNANQISREGFTLRIRYRDDASGIDNPSLHEGRRTTDIPLVELLKLDQLNQNNDNQKDGNFDFIEGVTIEPQSGYILFPVLEPFGSTLNGYFDADEAQFKEKYVYQELYDETQNDAQQIPKKDKFFITGKFNAGSSSEIALPGINIAEGSVVVTAGNTPLTEGLDYTVDYNLGRVRILNEGILSSGKTINISYEKADLFNFQARWLYGARLDYKINENFNVGATIMHLNERRGGVTRYQIGDEPTSNTKYGFDVNYQEEVPFLTKAMDFLPLVSTKEPSMVTINAEFAQLIPGTSNVVDGEGTSYIDDFEAAVNSAGNLGTSNTWKLAAAPVTDDKRFTPNDGSLQENDHRAKLAWYNVDASVFYNTNGVNQPSNIKGGDLDNHYERFIGFNEIYQKRGRTNYQTGYESSFDLAYFPTERGPYNYNTNLNSFVNNPEQNWGGITRPIITEVDFEKDNVEYIEFWLMDPFIEGENGRVLDGINNSNNLDGAGNGKLVFNLGSVSEDIIPDNRHMFESGMPTDGDPAEVSTSEWGNTPADPLITDNFQGRSKSDRQNQDVGFDGLRDDQEQNVHSAFLSANATTPGLSDDPSADNFRHFLDSEYDEIDAKIVQRYKDFNGMDGNTPVTNSAFPLVGSPTPDNEDLNEDNTVTTLEEYYEYEIDLNSDGLEIGQNHIADKVTNGEASWYLFRIPIREWDNSIGGISGYKTIRFVRMYLTGFKTPVVLRMVDLQFVKSTWRKYTGALDEPGLNDIPEGTESDFTVSAVNIEGNSSGADGKSPYVVPPGLKRDQDNTQFYNTQLNEQSLQICVEDLADKDARAVFKNVNFDLLNYGRLKMFFHAESHNGSVLNDDEVRAFLRLGTEQTDHYYEIEVPLKVTPLGVTVQEADANKRIIWPEENEIDLSISELLRIKSERNKRDIDLSAPYTEDVGRYKITIKGNPDLSTILNMMIGVRNPESNDRADKSVCIWANEMRVTDFDTNKGWAANARISTKLADVATINASTRYVSTGFGNIQQTIQQRTREETLGYDVSANVNVDRFLLPHKTGLVVPMFVSYEKSTSTPQFDPLDPDIPLKQSLEAFDTKQERKDYKRLVEDRTERRSINFTNVRKEKVNPEAKSHFYDVENLSFSYAFSEAVSSNINTETYLQRSISGGVAYNYSPVDFRIEPFAKGDLFKSPYLKLIKDINFAPLPNSLSFRADLNRNFRMTQLYNDELTTEGIDPYYERLFTFKRSYGLRYTPFKSLSIDYSAGVNAVIDELDTLSNGTLIVDGEINTQEEKDYIWGQIKNLGRMKNFDQDISATYRTPLDKLPFTDWLSVDLKYAAGYSWIAGSLSQNDSLGNFFGHTIMNSRNKGATGKIDMNKLYNKVTFLKAANSPKRGEEVSAGQKFLQFMMALKSINVTYNVREGTTLPGFTKTPFLLGMDSAWNAPSWKFLLGDQDPNIRYKAAQNGWLTASPFLTTPFEQTFGTDVGVRASIEPFKDLKIQLDAARTNNASFQEIFRFDSANIGNGNNGYASLTPSRSGSYSISILTIKTAFKKDKSDGSNPNFDQFTENIEIFRTRQNLENNTPGVYDTLSQDVLIPAFLSAYTGKNASSSSTNPFPKIPLPNWRVDYTGLTKIPALADAFSSITISHGYRSVYNVNNYTNSLSYDENISLDNNILNYPQATITNDSGVFVPVYIINQVSIAEQFTPLIGINVRTKNNLSTKFEYKRQRNLLLNMSNAQVNETQNQDFTFDLGFTKSDFKLPFKIKGRTVGIENDVTFRMAMTIRDSETVQRKLDGDATIVNGNTSFQFRPTLAYKFNDQLDLMAYFERTVNEPKVSNFKTATTAFGFQLRFSLAQ